MNRFMERTEALKLGFKRDNERAEGWKIWDSPLSDLVEGAKPYQLLSEIRKRTRQGPAVVLEVGCGTGRALAGIQEKFGDKVRVGGTNLSHAVGGYHIDSRLVKAAAGEYLSRKIAPESVHVLLDHYAAASKSPDAARVFWEYGKVLAPGGVAIVMTPAYLDEKSGKTGVFNAERIRERLQRRLRRLKVAVDVRATDIWGSPTGRWVFKLEKQG